MSAYQITLNLQAGGNIKPKSFVKLDTSNPLQCLQAGAGDTPIGISGNWTHYPPGTPSDDTFQATSGEFPEIMGMGCITPLLCGTGWTTGLFLKPDSNGAGAPVTVPASDIAGAIALDTANAGEFGRVYVLPPVGAGVIGVQPVTVLTDNLVATVAHSGMLLVMTAADKAVTLPVGAPGMRIKVLSIGTAAASGSVGTTLTAPTNELVHGSLVTATNISGGVITAASGKGLINTRGTATDGDYVEVTCTTAHNWYITGLQGIWVRVT